MFLRQPRYGFSKRWRLIILENSQRETILHVIRARPPQGGMENGEWRMKNEE
jgi:hypothetical protein